MSLIEDVAIIKILNPYAKMLLPLNNQFVTRIMLKDVNYWKKSGEKM